MFDPKEIIAEAALKLRANTRDLQWWAWPQAFSSTNGPHGGIGGQTITTFQVMAFENDDGKRIKWCNGIWRTWNGQQKW